MVDEFSRFARMPKPVMEGEDVADTVRQAVFLMKVGHPDLDIEADIKQALAAPEVKAKLEALSMEIRSGASEEMRAVLAGDIGKWGRLVKDRNIQIAQ